MVGIRNFILGWPMFRMLVSGRVFYINKFPKNAFKGSSLHHQGSPALQVCWVSRPPALDIKKTWDVGQFCSQISKKAPLDMFYPIHQCVFFEWNGAWSDLESPPNTTHGRKRTWVAFFLPFRPSHGAPVSSSKTTIPKLWTSVIVDETSELWGKLCIGWFFLMFFWG